MSEAESVWDRDTQHRSNLDVRRIAFGVQQTESEFGNAADEVALAYLPPRPRAAKRLINQLRLRIAVAQGRRLFKGNTSQDNDTARLIAKCCVLIERWPDLARAIENDVTILTPLEQAQPPSSVTLGLLHGLGVSEEVVTIARPVLLENPKFLDRFREVANLVGLPSDSIASPDVEERSLGGHPA